MTSPQATQSSGPLATLKMAQGNWPDHENAGKKATVAHDFCIFLYISVNFCIFMYIYVSYSIVCMYYPHDDWKKTRVHPWMRTAFRGFHISNWDWSINMIFGNFGTWPRPICLKLWRNQPEYQTTARRVGAATLGKSSHEDILQTVFLWIILRVNYFKLFKSKWIIY